VIVLGGLLMGGAYLPTLTVGNWQAIMPEAVALVAPRLTAAPRSADA
jgi:hypothetical protein